jgi:hypothetical protein
MGGAGGSRWRLASALLLVLIAALSAPGPAHAADGTRAAVLPGDAHAALVADVDGDGANELVRILGDRDTGDVVEAWAHHGETWGPLGSVGIPQLTRSEGDERMVPGSDASGLLVWQADGRSRVLVLARWGVPADDPNGFPCCVSIYELIWRDGAIHLEPRALSEGMADYVQSIDVDGDGTDELVRVVSNFREQSGTIEVLRWDGEAFRSIFREEGDGLGGGAWPGDTDGVAGDDLVLGPSPTGDVRRIAWADGGLVVEEAHFDLGERAEGYISGVADGAFVFTLPSELRIIRWPRGGEPVTTARLSGAVYPYGGIVGSGPGSLLAVQEPFFGAGYAPLTIHDLELNELGEVAPAPSVVRVGEAVDDQASSAQALERYLFPYSGPMPGATPGTPIGFVWAGHLVTAAPGGGYETEPIAPLAGFQPIGLAGPEDGWMALSGGYLGGGNVASLYSGPFPPGFGGISLVPVDELLRPSGVAPTVELRNAVALGDPGDEVTELVAGPNGFEVVVGAPVGSWISAWDGWHVEEVTMAGASVALEITPRRGRDDDEDAPIEASLLVVTPDGHATLIEWAGTYIRQPPQLEVGGRTDALAFSATLTGSVGPNATVTVDGRPMAVTADGGFDATVDAAPWPRAVAVVARDPLGNEVVELVEVVGLYDYRGLPWAAIVGAATLTAGVVLFVRIPRRRSRDVPDVGDGRLEELDPIDGTTFDGR